MFIPWHSRWGYDWSLSASGMVRDPGGNGGDELLEVGNPVEEGDDERVVDVGVAVHEHVTEPDGPGHHLGQIRFEHAVTTEESEGVGVRRRWSPSLRGTQVLGDVDATLDGGDEDVLKGGEAVGVGDQR